MRIENRRLPCLCGSWHLGGLLLVTGSIALVLIVFEITFRVKDALYPVELSPIVEPHPQRGWQARTRYHFSGMKRDASNREYAVEIITDENGFRVFGDLDADACRVFCIGDSFTFAEDADQSETYYAVAGKILDLNMFAYGAQGYGTLQEYLVLEEWLDRIKPDIVVWQFCRNDFINNSVELTRQSAKGQCHVDQPYLSEDGVIEYLNPGHGPLCRLLKHIPSRLFYSLAYRMDNQNGIPAMEHTIENTVERQGLEYPPFRRAVAATDRIFAMVRDRCGDIPVIAFNADSREPYASAFTQICTKHSLPEIRDISRAIEAAVRTGETVYAGDGLHWNGAGHTLCGKLLAETLRPLCSK